MKPLTSYTTDKGKNVPTFKVTPEDYSMMNMGMEAGKDKKHYPIISFPISDEIMEMLEVGKGVVVTLTGNIMSLENTKTEKKHKCEARMEIHSVDAYPKKKTSMKQEIDSKLGYSEEKD